MIGGVVAAVRMDPHQDIRARFRGQDRPFAVRNIHVVRLADHIDIITPFQEFFLQFQRHLQIEFILIETGSPPVRAGRHLRLRLPGAGADRFLLAVAVRLMAGVDRDHMAILRRFGRRRFRSRRRCGRRRLRRRCLFFRGFFLRARSLRIPLRPFGFARGLFLGKPRRFRGTLRLDRFGRGLFRRLPRGLLRPDVLYKIESHRTRQAEDQQQKDRQKERVLFLFLLFLAHAVSLSLSILIVRCCVFRTPAARASSSGTVITCAPARRSPEGRSRVPSSCGRS